MTKPTNLYEALLAIQTEIENPSLDDVGNFKNRFVSLVGARNHITPVANKYGVFIVQSCEPVLGNGEVLGIKVNTTLYGYGQELVIPFFCAMDRIDPQASCGASTYARRYGLLSAFGLVGDADDDGETAMGRGKTKASAPKQAEKTADKKTDSGAKPNAAKDLWTKITKAETEKEVAAIEKTLDDQGLKESEIKILRQQIDKKRKSLGE